MRLRRTLPWLLGALLALAVAAVLVLPPMLDWTRYRGTIEALASSSLGRLVRIEGGVSLSVLPQPVLTAGRISVADTGDGMALSSRELRLRVGLLALLGGRLDPKELTLRGAQLRLPWPLAPGTLTQPPPAWLSGLQARVEDGRLEIGSLVLTGINAGLSTDRDTGTLSVAGSGQGASRPWHFTARLGQPGRDGSATVEASVDGQGTARDTGAAFSGQLLSSGALSGRVSGRGPDLSQILPAPAVAWRAEGRLLVQAGLAIADELAGEIGGSPARGAVALRVAPDPRLDLAVAASQLDLDAWLPVLTRGTAPPLPTSLDLSSEAATLAGGTLRQLRGAFDLSDDTVQVREVSVGLPGETQLSLSGAIQRGTPAGTTPTSPPGAVPRFEGPVKLVAADLRTTLRWLEPLAPALVAALPPGVFRTAQLAATARMEPGQFSVADLQGFLDGSRLTGGASLRLGGARPHLGAGLALDQVSLDGWLPIPGSFLAPGTLAAIPQRLAGLDLELRLEGKRATWQGAGLSGVALDAQVEQGRLTIRRLDARVGGARLSASGAVGEAGRLADGKLDLTLPDAAALQPALRTLLPPGWDAATGLLRGPASVQATLSGPPDALALRLNGELDDLRVEAQPTINLAVRRWAGPLTLRHPGAPRLLEGLGIPDAADWLGDGSFSLLAQLDLQPGRLAADNFDLSAGMLRASGQLLLEQRDGTAVTGRIAAETLPLPLPQPWSPDPLPVAFLRGWRANVSLAAGQVLADLAPVMERASATLALEAGTLRLDRLAGRVAGGELAGTVALDAGTEPPRLSVQGSLAGALVAEPLLDLPFDLTAGRLDAQADLAATGHSFAALLASLSGTAGLAVQDGTVAGFDLPAAGKALEAADGASFDAAVRPALLGGTTALTRLDLAVRADRGLLQLDGSKLAGPGGTAGLAGVVDLPAGTLDLRLGLRPPPAGTEGDPAPEIAVRLTGPAANPRRTPELAGALRWLADRPR